MGSGASQSQNDTPNHWGARPVRLNAIQRSTRPLKDCNVSLYQEFILSDVQDGNNPYYYDITCLSDDRVVVVDMSNKRCCLYDSSFNHISDFMLPSNPWGICTVDMDEVAVTLPDEYKIKFLKISDKIKPVGQITTRYRCCSVVARNKIELVYAGTTPGARTYYWGVISRDGRHNSCFRIPRGSINYCTVYIALDASKTSAYISCYDMQTVYCFGLDGKIHFEYKVQEGENQGSPSGIQLDRENNVYVVVGDFHSIHQLSPDCQLQQIFKDTIPRCPHAISFQESNDKFLLTSKDQGRVNVCYVLLVK